MAVIYKYASCPAQQQQRTLKAAQSVRESYAISALTPESNNNAPHRPFTWVSYSAMISLSFLTFP